MAPASTQYDTMEKRFRDLQLRYSRSKKHIMYISLLVVSLFLIMMLGFLLKRPERAIDLELFGPQNGLYIVDTPNCRIFDYKPFNNDVKLYKAQMNYSIEDHPGSCGSLPPLSSVTRNASGHTLHLHKELFVNYSASAENTSCCYSYVYSSALLVGEEENATVDVPKYMYCQEFDDDVLLETDFDFVRVTCGKKVVQENDPDADPPSDVYKHFHSYVSIKREVRVKMELYNETIRLAKKFENDSDVAPWEKPWSVIIIGLDAVSRLNLLRMMPKTVDYLEKSGWYGLEGYNKVGDNTFPNLAAAVLAGSTEEQLRKTCVPKDDSPVDWCPWIWGRYAGEGYVTAYGEDTAKYDTFYLRSGGFRHIPTDYFLRTLLKAADDYTHSYWFDKFIQYYDCIGRKHESEYIMDFSLEYAEVLHFYPKFALFWLNSFSHDRLYGPKRMDEYLRNYLQKLTSILNDTIVVFMSDHGMAHGFYRQTEMGLYEASLPFIYFWVPESFKEINPKAMENLIANKNRLTSHFDLHMTLLDLLGDPSGAPGCPTCMSLFQPVPPNRTCADAGIPLRYCACSQYTKEPNTSHEYLAQFLIKEINMIVQRYQNYTFAEFKCAKFTLKTVNFIKRLIPKVYHNPWYKKFSNDIVTDVFVISIKTSPNATYEAMISKFKNGAMVIIDEILRIDSYDQGSRCLTKREGKPYCICEPKIDIMRMIIEDEKKIDAQMNQSKFLSSSVDPVENIFV